MVKELPMIELTRRTLVNNYAVEEFHAKVKANTIGEAKKVFKNLFERNDIGEEKYKKKK